MAEQKRIPLQSCPPESSSNSKVPASSNANTIVTNISSNNNNNNSKKKSEKKKKDKQIAPSIRFSINLFESNEQKYPEYNYSDLLKNAEKKRKRDKKKEEKNSSNTNGTNTGLIMHLDDSDEDDKVLDVARYFEEKYGNRKKNDYVDLGAGYDESDPFIDNTDMYDELVPQEVTTVHGGFYVNSGPLEFKDSDNVNELIKRHQINNDNDDEDEDESSDDDSEDDEEVIKNPGKRPLSSDNEEIDISHPAKSKPRTADSATTTTAAAECVL